MFAAFTGTPQTNPIYMSRAVATILDENDEAVVFPIKRRNEIDIAYTQNSNVTVYHADYIVRNISGLVQRGHRHHVGVPIQLSSHGFRLSLPLELFPAIPPRRWPIWPPAAAAHALGITFTEHVDCGFPSPKLKNADAAVYLDTSSAQYGRRIRIIPCFAASNSALNTDSKPKAKRLSARSIPILSSAPSILWTA